MAKKNIEAPSRPRRRAATPPKGVRRATGASRPAPGPTHDEIAEAAYQRYLKRGAGHGSDFDDWVEAERELRARPDPKSQ